MNFSGNPRLRVPGERSETRDPESRSAVQGPRNGGTLGGRAGLADEGLALGLERSARAVGTPGKEVHRVPEVSRGPLVPNGLALVGFSSPPQGRPWFPR